LHQNDTIAYIFENSPEIIILNLACLLTGLRACPLDIKRETPLTTRYKLHETKTKVLLYRNSAAVKEIITSPIKDLELTNVAISSYDEFVSIVGETDSYKAGLLADGIQDRFDYLIASHYGSFVSVLDLGKIEILISRKINVDPSQRDKITNQLRVLLTEYWKLRVAEHARYLKSDKVAAVWQAATEEQKLAIAQEDDDEFSERIQNLHPRGVRTYGLGKQVVAASNLSQTEIDKLLGAVSKKGLTIIPLKIYISKSGIIKLEIGLAKHKKAASKKRELRERDIKRETDRELRRRR